jgi:hypothetical protein
MRSAKNRSLLAAAHLLDAKIIFQSQGNFDPTLRDTPVFILIFVIVLVGALLDGVLRILVESLDIIERSALVSVERLSGHRPDAIDARKLPQDFVLFVFEKGSVTCSMTTMQGRVYKTHWFL